MNHGRALRPGTIVADEWRIERMLGEGGFGVTYEVRSIRREMHAALKEFMPAGCCSRDLASSHVTATPGREGEIFRWGLERFIKEAETLARLEHPSIVKVEGFFEANGTAYMALAYEAGGTLKDWLDKLGRRPTQAEIDGLLKPLLEALTQVHSLFLLHRDIKPDNIMMRADGMPVLIDFGAVRSAVAGHSRTLGGVNPAATSAFAVVSDGYSPPEQYDPSGRLMGPASDIYALGATIYTALTGERTPSGASRHFADEYLPLATRLAGSPYRPELLVAVDRALSVHPKDRPQSAMEFRRALGVQEVAAMGAVVAKEPTTVAAAIGGPPAASKQPPATPVTFSKLPSAPQSIARPRSRAGMMLASLAAAAMAAGGGWWMLVERPRQLALVEAAAVSKAADDEKARTAAAQQKAERRAEEEKERQRIAAARQAEAERKAAEEKERQRVAAAQAAAEAKRNAEQEAQAKAAAAAKQAEAEARAKEEAQKDAERQLSAAQATQQSQDPQSSQVASRSAPLQPNGPEGPPHIVLPDNVFRGNSVSGDVASTSAATRVAPQIRANPLTGTPASVAPDLPPPVSRQPRLIRRFPTQGAAWLGHFAFSPDGKTGVSGGCQSKSKCEPSLRLWDVGSGKLLGNFQDSFTSIQSVSFSRDGKYVLAGNSGDGTVALWDAQTRKYLGSSAEYGTWQAGAMSPDGKWVAGVNYQGKVRIFSVPALKLVREMPNPGNAFSVAFSPDSKFVVSADSTISKWEVATGKLIWSVKPTATGTSNTNIYSPQAFAFSADGATFLTGFSSGHVQLSSASNGAAIWTVVTNRVIHLSMAADERHFATGGSGACYYDPNKPERTLATFICPKHGSVKLWDVATRSVLAEITDIQGEGKPYFSPDGRSLMIIGYDLSNPAQSNAMALWDVSELVK